MYCPKCGTKNPDNGKFCRTCGTDLNVVSDVLTGKLDKNKLKPLVDKRGKPISWESALSTLFTGIAFVAVSIALANSAMGRGWWFWMLIPAFGCIGSGLAKIIQIKSNEKANADFAPTQTIRELSSNEIRELPPDQTEYISPVSEPKYKTGDLVPPSVTDNTTRHLEMDSEGETMTLPKPKL